MCAGGMYHGDMTEKLKLLYKLHLPHGKVTHVDIVIVTINGVFTSFLSVVAFCPEETESALDATNFFAANISQGKNTVIPQYFSIACTATAVLKLDCVLLLYLLSLGDK